MPNEDLETRYFNNITSVSEWRCVYYDRRYTQTGGTKKVNEHLINDHGLFTDTPRGTSIRGQVGFVQ
jgi:hypothetical protein